MKKSIISILALVIASVASTFSQTPAAPAPAPTTPSNLYTGPAIIGTVSIDYVSRKNLNPQTNGLAVNEDASKPYTDIATVNLRAKTVGFMGTLTRVPMIKGTKFAFASLLQPGHMDFSLNTGIVTVQTPGPTLKPNDIRSYGMWAGIVPINDKNEYQLAGITDSHQRMAIKQIGNDTAFTDQFDGLLRGRQEKPKGFVWKPQAIWQKVQGKDKQISVAKPDPMYDMPCVIAAGPRGTYPKCTVQGSFIYDRETYTYTAGPEGLRFTYVDPTTHKDTTDVMTGTLEFHPDGQQDSNGKSYYEFNLRFNDSLPTTDDNAAAKQVATLDDAAAATTAGANEHSLTGTITYVDTVPYITITGFTEQQPVHTDSTYAINATNLTPVQIVNFTKWYLEHFWPLNDE
jgi:hypothetical protein